MSVGAYSETFFSNNREKAESPGLLYCVVLVDKSTNERECVKIGITKGSNYRDAIKRSGGFKFYDIRIQKLIKGTLEEVFYLEQYLHELYLEEKYTPKHLFGGHTECFNLSALPKILRSIPNQP